jgi:glycosyltransferase involved in cell wall biosynthesis
MRICFIADSSSIHTQRIVSYFVEKNDPVLLLSTSRYIHYIPGVKTIHLLNLSESLTPRAIRDAKKISTLLSWFKTPLPVSLKSFLSLLNHHRKLLALRQTCLTEILAFKPDAIFCNRCVPEGVLGASTHIKPLILRTAGPDISKFTKYPIYRNLIREALHQASSVITQSIHERAFLKGFCPQLVEPAIINIGVDQSLFSPPTAPAPLRAKYGIPEDSFVIVSNRNLNGHYNGWEVVEAVASILHYCPNLFLLYASPYRMDQHTRSRAAALQRELPQLIFLDGPTAHVEMPSILGCGDIYISVSSYDGIPNSVLEAMACGLVPIVADLPQLHEWIQPGRTGYIVPQHDITQLASAIRTLYSQREQLSVLSPRCIDKIRTFGSYESCMYRMRQYIHELIERTSSDDRAHIGGQR